MSTVGFSGGFGHSSLDSNAANCRRWSTPFHDDITSQAAKINTNLEGDALKLFDTLKDRYPITKLSWEEKLKNGLKFGACAATIIGFITCPPTGIFCGLLSIPIAFEDHNYITTTNKLSFAKMYLKVHPKATDTQVEAAIEKMEQEQREASAETDLDLSPG